MPAPSAGCGTATPAGPWRGASLLCALDGAPVRPLAKPGGYLILLNLSQGPHRLALRCHGYQEEWVDFPVEGAPWSWRSP